MDAPQFIRKKVAERRTEAWLKGIEKKEEQRSARIVHWYFMRMVHGAEHPHFWMGLGVLLGYCLGVWPGGFMPALPGLLIAMTIVVIISSAASVLLCIFWSRALAAYIREHPQGTVHLRLIILKNPDAARMVKEYLPHNIHI